ncbi:MAG: hypothetical protein MZW92_52770 [Comamonadaceae bacterium]|nr:hypothetical protein [Comamonadaceae bacterium]
MLSYVTLGAAYAFAAAVQPGPFQAHLVASTLTRGLRRTLPAVLAPLLSDVPIIVLVLLVLTQVPPIGRERAQAGRRRVSPTWRRGPSRRSGTTRRPRPQDPRRPCGQ